MVWQKWISVIGDGWHPSVPCTEVKVLVNLPLLNIHFTTVIVIRFNVVDWPFLQENYFGADQKFTDYSGDEPNLRLGKTVIEEKDPEPEFDPRHYRPLQIKLQVNLHEIHGHLIKVSSPLDEIIMLCLQPKHSSNSVSSIALELVYSSPSLIRPPYLPSNFGHIREVGFGEREKQMHLQ